jgi:large subunit ribosomal protein L4
MPVVDVYSLDNKKTGTVDLDPEIFDVEVREHLFHELVRAQLGKRRAGTAKTKERNEVIGTQAKAWRQKGTGRARQGSRKAPHWVGGGTVFGPQPRSFAKKVNKKIARSALCAALSRRQQEGQLVVVENFELAEIKTSALAAVLEKFDTAKALLVDGSNMNLALSARNLPNTQYLQAEGLNVYDVLYHDSLMVSRQALEEIEGRLKS